MVRRFVEKVVFRRRKPAQPTLPGMRLPREPLWARTRRQPSLPGMRPPPRLRLVGEPVSRRGFLSGALAWVTAAIAAALGIPAAAAAVAPALRKKREEWSPIGRPGHPGPGEPDLAIVGKPLLTSFRTLVQDAYLKAEPQNVPVYVINWGDGRFSVYDVRCTHLGCPVSWDEKTQKFYSPCHGGVFDIQGRVLAGPPPRPLDRYEWKLENGVLYAGKLYRVNEKLQRVTD